MKKTVMIFVLLVMALGVVAQPPSDSSPTYPSGAAYTLSDGSTLTLTGQTYSTSTQYYNVIQVSNGTLNLINCT
ncbi:MAG: hypothetical protein II878_07870, partial [Bacteroidales bacterium]|nr:hypothetical protein [Bacteroidales bacterium]